MVYLGIALFFLQFWRPGLSDIDFLVDKSVFVFVFCLVFRNSVLPFHYLQAPIVVIKSQLLFISLFCNQFSFDTFKIFSCLLVFQQINHDVVGVGLFEFILFGLLGFLNLYSDFFIQLLITLNSKLEVISIYSFNIFFFSFLSLFVSLIVVLWVSESLFIFLQSFSSLIFILDNFYCFIFRLTCSCFCCVKLAIELI